jgi:hypothetical protein
LHDDSSKHRRSAPELAHRAGNGVEVSLYWSKASNGVTVEVLDTLMQERFELHVDPSRALDGFRHPFAYAAAEDVVRYSGETEALAA